MSDDLKTQFETAVDEVQKLPQKPDNDTLLDIYSLYKQSTKGDCTGKRPGMLDFVGRAKYDAWNKLKGKPSDQAMQTYIDIVERLKKG